MSADETREAAASAHTAETADTLCGRRSGDWECRAPKDHAEGMHVWGSTDDRLLFHSGWSEARPFLALSVMVDRETALRLLRDAGFRAEYAGSLRVSTPHGQTPSGGDS